MLIKEKGALSLLHVLPRGLYLLSIMLLREVLKILEFEDQSSDTNQHIITAFSLNQDVRV